MANEAPDEDLADGIRIAKKRPCNFALIAKGPEPVKLIIQKKPILDGALAKAKTQYKGNAVITGVVVGGGSELEFQVQGGPEAEPSMKTAKLKEFIAEQAEITIKPVWKCVAELPNLNEEEEGAPSESQEAPSPPTEAPPVPPPPPAPPPPVELSTEGKTLMAMLNKLAPAIQQAVAAHPARRNEIVGLVGELKKDVQETRIDEAKQKLKILAGVLNELKPATAPPPQNPTAQSPPTTPPQQQQQEAPPPVETNPLAERWTQEFANLQPRYLEALKKADSGLASQLKVVFTFATEQAEAGSFDRALKGLERLEPLIETALSNKGPGGAASEIASGIVAKRKFLLDRWKQIPGEINANLGKLKTEIGKVPDENPTQLINGIQTMLREFYLEMKESIDDSINSGDSESVRKTISEMRTKVSKNDLVQLLKKSPLDPQSGVNVEQVLNSALDEVEDGLVGKA